MGRIRSLLLGRLLLTLTIALGVMQVVIGHWVTVILAGRNGPGPALGLLLAAGLVGANLLLLPVVRRARRSDGWPRLAARLYVHLAIATLLLGSGVVVAWVGALPAAALLAASGVSPEAAFEAFRITSIGVVAVIGGLLVWGFTGGQASVQHSHLRVPLAGMDDSLRGLRIVQLSDLHIGNGMEGSRLERLVRSANALQPDLLVLTGDLFDSDPAFVEPGARALAALGARLGVYAVLGNHDAYTGTERVARALSRLAPSITLLRKDLVRVPAAAPLYVAGIDDPGHQWAARGLDLPELEELARLRPTDGPVLLLVHRPELFPQAARLGFPLVLAGHTHGGQLAIPFVGERWNLARILTPYSRGLFRENGSTLYVNRGAGVAGPSLRIGCPREIATVELG
jgi:predicted MPP superfamily phosphohydrolase